MVPGAGRGREIGIPTANLEPDPGLAVPGRGVYAVLAGTDQLEPAVANVGTRPTFDGETETVEVHLLDSSPDLYGERVRVAFVARIRNEKRFDGVEALVSQIHADIDRGRELLAEVL